MKSLFLKLLKKYGIKIVIPMIIQLLENYMIQADRKTDVEINRDVHSASDSQPNNISSHL